MLLLFPFITIVFCHPSIDSWASNQSPWLGEHSSFDYKHSEVTSQNEISPIVAPTPTIDLPTPSPLYSPSRFYSSDLGNKLALDPKAMLISPYKAQGLASDYYIVAVPKPTFNTTKIFKQTPPTTTERPKTIVEIVKSIELPIDQMPFASETSQILSHQHVRDHVEAEVESKKTKRSDETASTSLFRPETVNGFRELFKIKDDNTKNENTLHEGISGKNLTGPVIVTRSPINIFVEDPGLVNLMYNQFKLPMKPYFKETRKGY